MYEWFSAPLVDALSTQLHRTEQEKPATWFPILKILQVASVTSQS